MAIEYASAFLRGMSSQAFDLMGKPCLGASYTGKTGDKHALDYGARCCICGKPAVNAHHCPPKGMGGGNAFELLTPRGSFTLRAPLFAVCGSGNVSGCHELFHSGRAFVRWEWDSDYYAKAWMEGRMRPEYYRNNPVLFAYGRYVLSFGGGEMEVRPC